IQNGNDEFNENQIAQENNPDPNVEYGQGKDKKSNPSDVPFEGSNSQKGMASVTMHNEEWVADHNQKLKVLDQKKEAIEGLQSTEKDADKLRVLNALAQQNRLAFQVLRLSENLTDSVFSEIFSPQELQRWNLAEINALQNIKSGDSLGSKVNAENVLVVSSTPESKVRDEKRNAVFDTTSVSMEAQQELKVDPAYSLYVSERKALVELDKNKQNQEKELMLIKSKYIRALNNDASKEDLLVLENQLKDLAVKGLQIQALLDRRIEKIESFEKHLAFSTLISRNIAPEVGGKVEQPVMAANMAFSINEQNDFHVNQAFPVTDKMPNGLIFRVQVGAFREAVPSYFFREFTPVSGEKRPNGLTCYMAGYFVASTEAFVAQKNIRTSGYADAYLVAYCDGKRISIQEGLVLEKNGTCTKRNADEVFAEVSAIYNGSIQTDAPVMNVPKEVYYTVQVAAIKTPIKAGQLKDVPDLIYNLSKTGMYKYSSGKFLDVNEAKKRKNEIQAMGITDAYIVAYRDGLPISFAEAALAINHLNKQQPAPIENSVVEAQDLTGTSRVLLENLPQIVFQKSVAQYQRMDFEYLNQFESFVFDSIEKTYETNPLDVSMISPLEYIYYADMTATSIDSNANDLLKITVPKNNMKEAVMHDFALHTNIPYVLQRTEPGLSFSFTPRNEKERSQLETMAQTNQFEINIPLK
ncbi:MAG: SPOR domain-containing protein, partial [Flavobacteriia bacterium]